MPIQPNHISDNTTYANESWWKSDLFLSLAITLIGFLVTYWCFGFYYIDYEGLHDSLFSGNLTHGQPFPSLYFLGNIGLSFLYSYLYEIVPGIEWISWFLYSYLFIACTIGLYVATQLLPKHTSLSAKVLVLLFVYWFVFADHQIHFIYTRVSYMLCGLSFIGLVVLFPKWQNIKQRKTQFVLLQLFVTVGILTRVESATATLSLLLFFAWFYLQDWKQCLRLFAYPSLLTGILVLTIAQQIKNGKEFYLQIEPDIELQYGERQNMKPLSDMKTHRDSVLYITAANIMWSDPKTLNPTYLRSLIKPERFIYTDLQQWRRTFSDISVVTHKYSFLILVNLMLAILLLLTTSLVYHRLSLFYFILFESSFWILNIMQTYTAKINDRSFAPYLSLLLFCHVVLLLSAKGNTLLQRSYLLLSAALILLFIQLSHLKTEAITLNSDLQKYQYNFKKIKAIATNKHLALNGSSIDYLCLSNTPFHPFDFSAFKRVYITDGSIIPFLPYYKDYLESECRCDIYAFPSFWNYLHSIRQETIIVSTPERLQIAKDYLREIHHFNLTVTENTNCKLLEARKSENRENPDQLKIYTIENDSTADYLTK